jgi:hypothetical protein
MFNAQRSTSNAQCENPLTAYARRAAKGAKHCKNVIKGLHCREQFLFDENYWGEVREEGIMPALPRNYYGGFEIFF